MARRFVLAVLTASILLSCNGAEHGVSLIVLLETDYLPGEEFAVIHMR